MRLAMMLILLATLSVSARGTAQKVTINETNAPLENVIKQLQQQSGYDFFYKGSTMDLSRPVTLSCHNIPIEQALKACFEKQPRLSYSIVDKVVIIKVKAGLVKDAARAVTPVVKQVDMADNIRGKITSDAGMPIAGATIRIEGQEGKGTLSNAQGEFELSNVDESTVLVVSSVGYATKTVKVGNRRVINIILTVIVNELDETVVIGYGQVQKKDLTGSVSTITAKDIQDVPFLTADNAIAGKAAGVQVTKTDGTPGGTVRIRVRGSTSLLGGNDPLYVIDGVPVQVQSNFINPGFDVSSPVGNDVTGAGGVSSGMSTAFVNALNSIGGLNVDDIESITILKDASSTAIYGSKAANGVVIIQTKQGKKDMQPQVMFSYYGTWSKPLTPTLLNADQYKTLLSEAAKNDYDYRSKYDMSISPELDAIVHHADSYFGKGHTDWLKEVTRNTLANNIEVAVRGGGNATKYYSSISYNSTPGVIKNSSYERIAGKLNLENEIGRHLRFITNLNLGYSSQNVTDGAYQQALRARPDYTPYDSAGAYSDFSGIGYSYQGFQNPVAMLTALNQSKTFNLLGSLSGIYKFTNDLEFKSTISLNMQDYTQRNYTPSYLAIGSFYGNVENKGGIGANSNSHLANWFWENTLTWNKQFDDDNSLNLLGGYSYETRKYSFFSATATGYPNDDILNSLSSAVTPLFTKGDNPSKPQSYLVSYYLRANYGFKDKYLVTFTGRADGSSKFGPENKYGYFPSGALAWRVSKENFLKDVHWVDDLKLRGSYGITGSQNIADQMYRTLYSPYSYAGTSALIPTQLGNAAIQWESTKQTDLGLDFAFFNSRLSGTVDYYRKETSGALLSLPVAPSSSYSSLLGNVASLRSTGLELSLEGDIIRNKDFRWSASMNITWPTTLVTKISEEADLSQLGNLTGLEYGNVTLIEGKPLGLITGLKIEGIIHTEAELEDYRKRLGFYADPSSGYAPFAFVSIGDPMFKLDGSESGGQYPAFDQIIGSAAPNCYGGFTQSFTYKNLNLNFYFTYSQGGSLMWGDGVSSINFVGTSNANAYMLGRWTPDNPNSNNPRLLWKDQALMYNTSLSVFDASYLKLRTVTLSYLLGQNKWLKNKGIQNASVFFSATNIFTITSYPGNDPETSDDPFSVAGGYFDVSNYPTVRSLSLGLKMAF